MGVTPGRVSQTENGDLDANEVATLSRYARAAVHDNLRWLGRDVLDFRALAASGDQ
jgi:hypothetical protein